MAFGTDESIYYAYNVHSIDKSVQNDFVYLNHLQHDWMDTVSYYDDQE